jgi:molybdopterin-guanine dinucleotide biosynthesis protein
MKLVMVGGHTRNIGKTSVVEGIIRGTAELNWTAAKITQYGHGICSVNGEACGCAATEHQFSITEERQRHTGTDSARFLAAGAARSLWVRTKQGELVTALPALREYIQEDEFVIVESNSLRRFMNPTIYLQVVDETNADVKISSQEFFDLSDAYVLVSRPQKDVSSTNAVLLAREILRNKPCFTVSEEDRFISGEIIEFVRSKLEVGEPNGSRQVQQAS